MRRHLGFLLIALALAVVSCTTKTIDPQPVGQWREVMSGRVNDSSWRLFETRPDGGGRCMALEVDPPTEPPLTETGPERPLHEGKDAACAPDPENVHDRLVFFDWNERVVTEMTEDAKGALVSQVTGQNNRARLFYLAGRLERSATDVQAELDDGSVISAREEGGTFLFLYSPPRGVSALRVTSAGKAKRCRVDWADAVPTLRACAAAG